MKNIFKHSSLFFLLLSLTSLPLLGMQEDTDQKKERRSFSITYKYLNKNNPFNLEWINDTVDKYTDEEQRPQLKTLLSREIEKFNTSPNVECIYLDVNKKPGGFTFIAREGDELFIRCILSIPQYKPFLLDEIERQEGIQKVTIYVRQNDPYIRNLYKKRGYKEEEVPENQKYIKVTKSIPLDTYF